MLFEDCRRTFTGGVDRRRTARHLRDTGLIYGRFLHRHGRRFVYVLGDPTTWPTLNGDSISQYRSTNSCRSAISSSGRRASSAPRTATTRRSTMLLSNLDQCCETKNNQNGFVNPTGLTAFPWTIHMWNVTSSEMGSP